MPGNTSGCSTFARGSGIKEQMAAIAERFIERLVAALLARANLHCVAVRLFSFRGREASPRPGHRSITPRLPAWSCRNPASQSRHLRFSRLPRTRVSLPHAKCRVRTNHSSHFGTVPPAPLAGLVSFPSAPFADALSFADFAGCSRSFRRSQTAKTGTDSGAPNELVIKPKISWGDPGADAFMLLPPTTDHDMSFIGVDVPAKQRTHFRN